MSNRYASLPGEVTRVSLYASKNPLDPSFVTLENLSALNLVCFGLALLNEHLRNGNNLELRAFVFLKLRNCGGALDTKHKTEYIDAIEQGS